MISKKYIPFKMMLNIFYHRVTLFKKYDVNEISLHWEIHVLFIAYAFRYWIIYEIMELLFDICKASFSNESKPKAILPFVVITYFSVSCRSKFSFFVAFFLRGSHLHKFKVGLGSSSQVAPTACEEIIC